MAHRLAPAPRATARSTARAQVPLVAAIQVLVMALWFSASAVVPQLQRSWGISAQEAGWLTSVVQIGFVAGALGSSTWNLPDRVPPRVLVGASSLVGTAATLSFALWADGLPKALFLRFVTGLALAGVYPVGMKVMVSWVERGRGQALGVLLAALTVGTGVPQLVRAVTTLPWQGVLFTSSGLAAVD